MEAIPRLFHFREKDLIVQTAMFIFHAHAKQTSYHIFDRFVYAMAALLLAGKMYDQLESAYEVVK